VQTPTKNGALHIGVLGAGPIAQFAHFEACRKARNAELYAICDLAPDLLAQMAVEHSPRVTYGDYDAMLADPHVDAVLIAVADQFHVPAAARALDAGKHVLVEKPLGVNLAECQTLADQVHEGNLVLQVGTMRRFDEGIAFARDFIVDELGAMIALKAWYCDSAYRYTMTDALQPVPRLSQLARRPDGDPKADRRRYYMLGHGSHLIDTARFLAGDIASVSARLVEKAGVYCWFVQVEFTSGAVGHLDLTMSVRMDWHEGFHVYGEHGSVIAKTFLPWYLRSSEVECFSAKDKRYHRPLGEDSHFFRRQVEGFADTILNGAPMRGATVDDGLAALRVMDAIEAAVESGAQVAIAPGLAQAL
jgi:predicted dehydrogenase